MTKYKREKSEFVNPKLFIFIFHLLVMKIRDTITPGLQPSCMSGMDGEDILFQTKKEPHFFKKVFKMGDESRTRRTMEDRRTQTWTGISWLAGRKKETVM